MMAILTASLISDVLDTPKEVGNSNHSSSRRPCDLGRAPVSP